MLNCPSKHSTTRVQAVWNVQEFWQQCTMTLGSFNIKILDSVLPDMLKCLLSALCLSLTSLPG